MKKNAIILLLLLPLNWAISQNLKPYIVGFETTETVTVTAEKLIGQLDENGIKTVGQYQPANDKNRYIIAFTSSDLENAIKKVGGLTGFAATLRIGITNENGKTIVSYTNPLYWGNAYFRGDFEKVSGNYGTLIGRIEKNYESIRSICG